MANYSFLDTETNPIDLYDAIINATDGVYPIGVLIGVFLVGYLALRRMGYDSDSIFIYMGAFEFLLTGFFIIKEYISYYFIMLPVLLLFTGIILNRTK